MTEIALATAIWLIGFVAGGAAGGFVVRRRTARTVSVIADEAVLRVVEAATPLVVAKVREGAASDEWDAWKRTYGPSYVEAVVTNARRKGGA